MAREKKWQYQGCPQEDHPLLALLPLLPELLVPLLEDLPDESVLAELPEVEVLWEEVLWDEKLLAEVLWEALMEALGAGL